MHKFFFTRKGVIYIELAFIFPIIVISGLVAFEIMEYMSLRHRLVNITGMILNVSTLPNLRLGALNNFVESMLQDTTQYNLDTKVKVAVSQIADESSLGEPSTPKITWQYIYNGASSSIGAEGDAPSSIPNDVEVTYEKTLIIVEVFYTFTGGTLGFFNLFPPKNMYYVQLSPPRFGTSNVLL